MPLYIKVCNYKKDVIQISKFNIWIVNYQLSEIQILDALESTIILRVIDAKKKKAVTPCYLRNANLSRCETCHTRFPHFLW